MFSLLLQCAGWFASSFTRDNKDMFSYVKAQMILLNKSKEIKKTYINEPPRGKTNMWFPNRSDTNRPVQAQKRARSLKFWI